LQVPLGVLLYNENKVDDIAKILDRAQVHKYIPVIPSDDLRMLPNGQMVPHKDFKVHCIPVTGDQVTVARIRGARAARHGSEKKLDRLEGIVPFVEDWHTRQTMMMVFLCSYVATYIVIYNYMRTFSRFFYFQ